jgi:hypothetical protein
MASRNFFELPERHRLVQGGRARLGLRAAPGRGGVPDALDELTQVLGGGAAAAADEGEAVVPDEGVLRVGQLGRGQRVVRAVFGQHRQARVGHAGQRDARVPGQEAQVLAHLGRARGAVQADHVDAERLQRGQGGADLGAEQHGAGRLDGHRDDQRHGVAGGLHGPAGGDDGGLGLEQVLRGLHEQRVGAAGEQALGVLLVGVPDGAEGGVAEGGQLGAGSHRAEHPALLPGAAGELVGHLTGDPGTGLGQLGDAFGDVVLAEGGEVGAEGVGLHAVHTDVEVRGVDRTDDVRARQVEDLVAALEILEVLERGVLRLEHGAHGSVGHDHPGGQGVSERGHTGPAVSGRGRRQRGHEKGSLKCDGCRLCGFPDSRKASGEGRTAPA